VSVNTGAGAALVVRRAALLFGGLLLLWSAIAGWRQTVPVAAELAVRPLFAVCENGRMALRTAPAEKGANANDDAACQPFTSRLIAINRAKAAVLSTVPGIGLVTAEKIVAYREHHGNFRSAKDLEQVPGIGAAKAGRFAEYLFFE